MNVERFVRFVDESGATVYGELPSSATGKLHGTSVSVLSGNPFDGFSKTGKQSMIKKVRPRVIMPKTWTNKTKLLSPIESTPIFMCIGLNYAHHAKEANVCPIPLS
jgi:2-keto-4-pentenoate hydratase/2-oxohepta-3-ene-1,7-dioic acid hydratase in catechol pathway